LAATRLNRKFVGIEVNEDYLDIALKRMEVLDASSRT